MRLRSVVALLALAGAGCPCSGTKLPPFACNASAPCADGYVCTAGLCVLSGTVTDAGTTDAGPRDAGGSDACSSETDSQLCAALGKACGPANGMDNCGSMRTVNCGGCSLDSTCDGGQCQFVPDAGPCPGGGVQCGNQCCVTGQTCVGGATCCTTAQACGGSCCDSLHTCLAGSCCLSSSLCGSVCCPSGQACVAGACCASGIVCGSTCCPSGDACVAGACCPVNGVCGTSCCDPTMTRCVNNQCCPTMSACGNACCPAGQTCLNNTACCPAMQACGNTCCPPGDSCTAGACCPSAQTCPTMCCPTGQSCVSGACCANGLVCGTHCCVTGQQCAGGSTCCATGSVCGADCCTATETCLNSACCANAKVCPTGCCGAGLLCINAGCCTGAFFGLVQSNTSAGLPIATTLQLAFSAAQRVGDLNLVAVGWTDTAAHVTAVSDSAGNAYRVAIGPTTGTGVSQIVYYAASIDAGANTVSVAFDLPANRPDLRIVELSGIQLVSPFDTADAGSGNGPVALSGNITTSGNHELVIGIGMSTGGFVDAGVSYSLRVLSADGIVEDKGVALPSTGDATAIPSSAGPNDWVMQVLCLKGC